MRPLPELTPATEWFWTSGADGHLRIQRCDACASLVHPPVPICPICRSRTWQPTVVSGRATVVGYTVNQHRWHPDFDPPYVIAVVALAEDPTVRLTTTIVGCDPGDVHIGQEVVVRFEQCEDVWLPALRADRWSGRRRSDRRAGATGAPGAAARRSLRAPVRAQRRGALGPRPAAHGRPALADRRRLPAGRGRRRAGARRHRRPVDVPGRGGHGHERRRRHGGRGGPPAASHLDQRRRGHPRPGRRADRRHAGRGLRPVPPRPVLPDGVGVDVRRPRRRPPGAAHAPRAWRPGARRSAPSRRPTGSP